MLIFGILLALVILGVVVYRFAPKDVGSTIMVLSLGMILVTMLTIPLARNQYIQEIYGFRDFSEFCKETGAIGFKQSENYDEFMQQVKEKNIWLVRTQHFNSGIWFDLWIPDEVDLLEQIK